MVQREIVLNEVSMRIDLSSTIADNEKQRFTTLVVYPLTAIATQGPSKLSYRPGQVMRH